MINKRGKILIDSKAYRNDIENMSKALAEIGFVPFRVEHLAMQDEFELLGYSTAFEPLEYSRALPEYTLVIELDDDGNYTRASVFAV
jgi:hypothetical protein